MSRPLRAVNYEGFDDANGDNVYEVEVEADDNNGLTTTQVVSVTVTNVDPTVSVDTDGTGNTVVEGAATGTEVGLTASSTDPLGPAVSYSLTNDDGGRFTIDSGTGVVTVADGSLLDGPVTHTITVEANDGAGGTSTVNFDVSVNNVAPTANDNAYNAEVFTPLYVTAAGVLGNDTDPAGPVNDPLSVTSVAPITTTEGATVVMNADGSFTYEATSSGTLMSLAEGVLIDDSFAYEITDGDGGVATATVVVTVTGASDNSAHVIDSPCGDGSQALVIRGSDGKDKIDIKMDSMANTFKIKIKSDVVGGSMGSLHGHKHKHHHGSVGSHGSFHMGTFKYDESVDNVDKVIVYGLDGNDDIKVHKNIGVMAWLFGGNGNDKIRGGDEDDMLVGGDGDDKLDGKRGRDVLIGGLGADKLRGDHGEDILIAAATAYDNNLASLVGIHQQWQVRDAYGQGDGEDTDDVIARTTIIRDTYFGGGVLGGAKDELKGGHDADWLIGMDGEDKFKDDSDDLFGLDNDWFDLD